ncbi:MAG: methylated-DNA--[protein]-cysteine S-methyltransferase [Cyanobacteria bacterium REEB65]|nr:methylated-DNA--[protein]-cysteine S-methyltransferase [Cyanobacteria bacterium REEB65]
MPQTRFETPLGACGIAWTPTGLTRIDLPPTTFAGCDDPPPFVATAIARITQHLAGDPQDFADLPLDFGSIGDFARHVYEAIRRIPAGRTATYGQVAAAIGSPRAARAVGRALGRNPFALVIPCHRVVATGGQPGGFSAGEGLGLKKRLLALEGVALPGC